MIANGTSLNTSEVSESEANVLAFLRTITAVHDRKASFVLANG